MEEIKRVYKHKCKSKLITFYNKDKALLDYANTINFQAFVKNALKEAMKGTNNHGHTIL